jgi:hypothetical protein
MHLTICNLLLLAIYKLVSVGLEKPRLGDCIHDFAVFEFLENLFGRVDRVYPRLFLRGSHHVAAFRRNPNANTIVGTRANLIDREPLADHMDFAVYRVSALSARVNGCHPRRQTPKRCGDELLRNKSPSPLPLRAYYRPLQISESSIEVSGLPLNFTFLTFPVTFPTFRSLVVVRTHMFWSQLSRLCAICRSGLANRVHVRTCVLGLCDRPCPRGRRKGQHTRPSRCLF